ncbi:hypothetical protein GIY23_12880 [Allosaccharopolyspora coralli]|uniref:Uncharacterized protein n=1 Tax=Allosaccharopolyspora coralli TaxID=2665642 RepID=A0A5Q3QFR5_9PSEU|nr:hypothetical protein [Allosaccharopolyspora coralli]QGK70299.1 hypothetical protein GIY23_12880 [Allosaccharopolyspora coralli]
MTRHPHRDTGSVSVLLAVLVPCLLLVFALVVDGTDRLRAQARADAVATETARAALAAVDTRGPTVTLDRSTATTAARRSLAAAGHTGTVGLDGSTVRVTVTHQSPAAIGLLWSTHHVTGQATADLTVATSTPRTQR